MVRGQVSWSKATFHGMRPGFMVRGHISGSEGLSFFSNATFSGSHDTFSDNSIITNFFGQKPIFQVARPAGGTTYF